MGHITIGVDETIKTNLSLDELTMQKIKEAGGPVKGTLKLKFKKGYSLDTLKYKYDTEKMVMTVSWDE